MESIYKSDVVVVGSGISGLMVAISLYPRKVTLVTKKKLGEMSSSAWAQGGIAASVGTDDHPDIHYADTIKASSGLNNQDAVRLITSEALDIVKFLEKINIQFDKDKNKNFNLLKEEFSKLYFGLIIFIFLNLEFSDLLLVIKKEPGNFLLK